MTDCVNVDCAKGRSMGCQTFCCRLLVRLDPDERNAGGGTASSQGFVKKNADGYCVNLDRETHLCRTWASRSRACRGYDCNSDFLLQVAVRRQFKNIVELVRMAATAYIPKENHVRVPSSGNSAAS